MAFEKTAGKKDGFEFDPASDPKKRATAKRAPKPRVVKTPITDPFNDLMSAINKQVSKKIDDSVDEELEELRRAVRRTAKLTVKTGDMEVELKGIRHKQLEHLIKVSNLRLHSLIVGMAGTGKTHSASQTAEALGLPFYAMSVGAQTSKSDIIGYMSASGKYVKTHFRDAYQKGGVFLMDEIDSGNANVLIQINSALSNDMCAFPDRMVKRHKNFVFIASANTYGQGMNRQYVGRNQLDAATLDRFTIIEWDIDSNVEEALSGGPYGAAWYAAVLEARAYVGKHNIRSLITPRATQKGCLMLASDIPLDVVIHATLLGSVPDDKKDAVYEVAQKAFDAFGKKKLPEGEQSELDEDGNPKAKTEEDAFMEGFEKAAGA